MKLSNALGLLSLTTCLAAVACDSASSTGGAGGTGGTGGADGGMGGSGGASGGAGGTGGAAATALVRVSHLSPDAPDVDFCVSSDGGTSWLGPVMGSLLQDANGLTYKEITQYLELPVGSYSARIVAPGSANCDASLAGLPDIAVGPVAADQHYTLHALGLLIPTGQDAPLQFAVTADDQEISQAGQIQLTFVHASPNAPAVDVGILAGATFTPLFPDTAFSELQVLETDPTPALDLSARPAGVATDVLVVSAPALPAGSRVTAFAVGLLGDALSPLEVLACLDHEPAVGGLSVCVTLPEVN